MGNKFEDIEDILKQMNITDPEQIKRVKRDKGLIERAESTKIILTEDNRQILTD